MKTDTGNKIYIHKHTNTRKKTNIQIYKTRNTQRNTEE